MESYDWIRTDGNLESVDITGFQGAMRTCVKCGFRFPTKKHKCTAILLAAGSKTGVKVAARRRVCTAGLYIDK